MQCSSKTKTWRLLRVLFLRRGPVSADPGQTGRYAAVTPRRLPPPWSVEEQDACFVVRDHSGQKLAYVYFEDEPRFNTMAMSRTRLTAAL